jgi:hypothetical protein
MTLPLDSLTEVIDSLSELKRMYQLNVELLEQLAVTCEWLKKSGVHIPNEDTFNSLLNKTTTLLDEIQADSPKTLLLTYQTNCHSKTDPTKKSQNL